MFVTAKTVGAISASIPEASFVRVPCNDLWIAINGTGLPVCSVEMWPVDGFIFVLHSHDLL